MSSMVLLLIALPSPIPALYTSLNTVMPVRGGVDFAHQLPNFFAVIDGHQVSIVMQRSGNNCPDDPIEVEDVTARK